MYPIFPAQLADTINLGSEFSIVHSGNDMTANLVAAFAKYGARKYRLPRIGSGLCVFASAITIPNGAFLESDDDVAISALQIKVSGSVGSEIAFSAAGNKGDQAIQLISVAGIAPDSWLVLKGCVSLSNSDGGSDQLLWDSTASVYAGEYVRVASVSGNTVNIWGALRWSYTLAPGPTTTTRACSTAQVINFGSASIRRGTIQPIVGSANSVIQGVYARGLKVEEVKFDHTGGGASPGEAIQSVALFNCIESGASKCTVLREPYGYGVGSGISLHNSFVYYGSSDCWVRDCAIDGGAQSVDLSYNTGMGGTTTGGDIASWGHDVSRNTVRNAYDGLTSHGGGKAHSFIDNVIEDSDGGIKVRSKNTVVSGNRITGITTIGTGVYFMDGFIDGCIGDDNEVEGVSYGYYVNWNNAGGPVQPGRVTLKGGTLTRCYISIYIQTAGTVQQMDTQHRAVRVLDLESINPTGAHTHVDSYANGFEVDRCTFVGAPTSPVGAGVINLPANIADIRIGVNEHTDTGSLVAIAGPGSTILADATTWPAGDASANWTIDNQLLRGTNGGLSTGLPSNNLFLGANGGYINDLRQGRLALQGGATQATNPLAVSSGASDLFAINASGKLTGSVADAFMPAVYAAGMTDAMALVFNTLFAVQATVTGGLHGLYGLNFISGPVYRAQGAAAQNLLTAVSGWSLTRSGSTSGVSARAYDTSGNGYLFLGSTARLVSGRGLGIFETATNLDTNGDMAGSPHPTNWQIVLASGLSYTETGTGTEFGREYVEIAISGSTSSSLVSAVQFTQSNEIAALTGQTFVVSHGLRLSAGSLTNVSAVQPRFTERNSGGGAVLNTYGSALTVTSALQDVVFTNTLSGGATTAYVCPALAFTSNGAVSFSLRIYEPMTRQAAVAVPYVETTGSATATVGGDVATLTSVSLGSAWTCFVEAETNASDTAAQVLAQWDDGTDNNRIVVYRDTSGVVWVKIYVAGAGTFTASINGQTGDITVRVAISVGSGNINVSFNQGSVATSAAPSLPTPTELRLGNNAAGTAAINGYARAALFGTSALTGSALQALQA